CGPSTTPPRLQGQHASFAIGIEPGVVELPVEARGPLPVAPLADRERDERDRQHGGPQRPVGRRPTAVQLRPSLGQAHPPSPQTRRPAGYSWAIVHPARRIRPPSALPPGLARNTRLSTMKRTHLPLNALRVFDAAARHLSFT